MDVTYERGIAIAVAVYVLVLLFGLHLKTSRLFVLMLLPLFWQCVVKPQFSNKSGPIYFLMNGKSKADRIK